MTTLRTPLCDLFGITYPVMLAGMGPIVGRDVTGVAGPELVAAVSNAGGLGVLGGTGFGPDEMAEQIRRIQELTDKPFGVDILLPTRAMQMQVDELPADRRELIPDERLQKVDQLREELGLPEVHVDLAAEEGGALDPRFTPKEQVDVIVEMGVPVLAFGLGSPEPYLEQIHAAGAKAVSLVGTVTQAQRLVATDVDCIVAQGTEAGGHTGRIGTLALLPQVLDAAGDIPVVAAGGIGDGRGLAAVLALGCAGAWCGTVFIPTLEANLDDFRKRRVLDAPAEGTRVTRIYSGKTMRNVTNDLIEAFERSRIEPMGFGLQDALMADVFAAAQQAERYDLEMNAAGQIAGLLTDLKPAGQVLLEMVSEAAEILSTRLAEQVTASV